MPSRFDSMFAAETPGFLSEFGETVSYTPQGGSAKNISAIFEPDQDSVPFETEVNRKYKETRVQISSRSDVEGHISPLRLGIDGGEGDSFAQSSGRVWHVVDVLHNGATMGDGMHVLLVRDRKIPIR